MIVIADTSPLNYLILIGHVEILKALYSEVVIPPAVHDELLHLAAPEPVKAWAKALPQWIEIRTPSRLNLDLDIDLGNGEREAIALAYAAGRESLLLIDEQLGRREATRLGLSVAGTLGIVDKAAKQGLLNLHEAIEKLRATNFKAADALLNQFLGGA